MKDQEESRLEHLKDEFKEEALLFKGRAEVAVEDIAETVESKIISMADAIQGETTDRKIDYLETLEKEADRVFRQQIQLLSYLKHVKPDTIDYSSERIDGLESTLKQHLDELQGEYRSLSSSITNHQVGMADKLASISGTFSATSTNINHEFDWSPWQEILGQVRRISATYQVIHALALGMERSIAAGMAWNHLRKIDIHGAELVASVYHIIMSNVSKGKPIEPVVDQAIEEWKQTQESALKHASREPVEDVVE